MKTALQDPGNPDVVQLSQLLSEAHAVARAPSRPRFRARKNKLLRAKIFGLDEPVRSAKLAGLRYVSDLAPGITRIRKGKGFYYKTPEGKKLTDPQALQRIRALAIPPAYRDVWICPIPEGHLQATGRDARNRKQYRYHPLWKEVRDASKFERMVAFGEALPAIRLRVDEDLSLRGLPREKVLATIVRLLETTLIRVGNEEYAKQNGSYGLTTLRVHHVSINGSQVKFRFTGKGGKTHDVGIKNRRLARVIQRCREIPGQELFQYIDESGQCVSIGSADVNAYLRDITGHDFTAKDFRTWAGTVLTGLAFKLQQTNGHKRTKKQINEAVKAVAECLRNTPAVCRKSYIHPALIRGYEEGKLLPILEQKSDGPQFDGLAPEEAQILDYLRSCA